MKVKLLLWYSILSTYIFLRTGFFSVLTSTKKIVKFSDYMRCDFMWYHYHNL